MSKDDKVFITLDTLSSPKAKLKNKSVNALKTIREKTATGTDKAEKTPSVSLKPPKFFTKTPLRRTSSSNILNKTITKSLYTSATKTSKLKLMKMPDKNEIQSTNKATKAGESSSIEGNSKIKTFTKNWDAMVPYKRKVPMSNNMVKVAEKLYTEFTPEEGLQKLCEPNNKEVKSIDDLRDVLKNMLEATLTDFVEVIMKVQLQHDQKDKGSTINCKIGGVERLTIAEMLEKIRAEKLSQLNIIIDEYCAVDILNMDENPDELKNHNNSKDSKNIMDNTDLSSVKFEMQQQQYELQVQELQGKVESLQKQMETLSEMYAQPKNGLTDTEMAVLRHEMRTFKANYIDLKEQVTTTNTEYKKDLDVRQQQSELVEKLEMDLKLAKIRIQLLHENKEDKMDHRIQRQTEEIEALKNTTAQLEVEKSSMWSKLKKLNIDCNNLLGTNSMMLDFAKELECLQFQFSEFRNNINEKLKEYEKQMINVTETKISSVSETDNLIRELFQSQCIINNLTEKIQSDKNLLQARTDLINLLQSNEQILHVRLNNAYTQLTAKTNNGPDINEWIDEIQTLHVNEELAGFFPECFQQAPTKEQTVKLLQESYKRSQTLRVKQEEKICSLMDQVANLQEALIKYQSTETPPAPDKDDIIET